MVPEQYLVKLEKNSTERKSGSTKVVQLLITFRSRIDMYDIKNASTSSNNMVIAITTSNNNNKFQMIHNESQRSTSVLVDSTSCYI